MKLKRRSWISPKKEYLKKGKDSTRRASLNIINFFKLVKERIYVGLVVRRLNDKLKTLKKERQECLQELGERVYEFKKDSSFQLIDLASINTELDKLKDIDLKIKEANEALKEVKGREKEGVSSWWSRWGSNPRTS